MKKKFILIPFLLGFLSCFILNYFLRNPYHPFPNFPEKYQYPALLTPQMTLEHHKAIQRPIPTCAPPKTLILCYDDRFLKNILQKYHIKPCANVYLLTDYPSVAIARFGWTGPLNAIKLERAIAWGIKQVIAIGSSAGLQKDISLDDILVCEKSIRDEGTSHHYLPYSKYAYPSPKLQKKLLHYLKKTDTLYKLGPSWTTDGFYRITKKEVKFYQKEGVLNVEMEAATLFTVAAYRNIDMIALFSITDSYSNLKWEKAVTYKEKQLKTMDRIFEIALKVAIENS